MQLGGAPKCDRCVKSVYPADKVIFEHRVWHKTCFRCNDCSQKLETMQAVSKDDFALCRACVAKRQPLSTTAFPPSPMNATPPSLLVETGSSGHSRASQVAPSPKSAGSYQSVDSHESESPRHGPIAPSFLSQETMGAPLGPKPVCFGSKEKCARCGTNAYHAESLVAAGSKWHKNCFRCLDCKVGLDMSKYADNNGEVYCRACHARRFGPKGYGFNGGAAFLHPEGTIA